MATIHLKGNPVHTNGDLPAVGSSITDFRLVDGQLNEVSLQNFANQNILFNIFPSIDTGVCAASAKKFNEKANQLTDTKVLCVSMDLPFALKRYCEAEGLKNIIPLSDFRHHHIGNHFGLRLIDGPLAGLLARAVVVVDKDHKVIYTQLVNDITEEPDYEKALQAVEGI